MPSTSAPEKERCIRQLRVVTDNYAGYVMGGRTEWPQPTGDVADSRAPRHPGRFLAAEQTIVMPP